MNRAEFIAGTLATIPLAQLSAQPQWTAFGGGESILRPFASAPFPHSTRAQGHTYAGKFYDAATHYSDSTVGIFVPPGYVKKDTVDLVVHFHGWNNNVAGVLARYRLREQLAQSNVNAILVVPQGPFNAPDSADGKLEEDDHGFARLAADVLAFLGQSGKITQNAALGNVVMSAHSGGYAGLGGSLIRGGINDHVSDVMLFDAAYAYLDAIVAWAKSSPHNHLVSVFTDDTAKGNAFLQAQLSGTQRTALPPLSALQDRKPVFLYTSDVPHDEVMQKYNWYELFLQTTALVPR